MPLIFAYSNILTSRMNSLPPEVLFHVLQINAQDIVHTCMQIQGPDFYEFPTYNKSMFMAALTDYRALCQVNSLFHYFTTTARVEGKLLKATLMDLSISRFGAMLQMTEFKVPYDSTDFHLWMRQATRSCGFIWRNPRLWSSLPSFLSFCDELYSRSYESPSQVSKSSLVRRREYPSLENLSICIR